MSHVDHLRIYVSCQESLSGKLKITRVIQYLVCLAFLFDCFIITHVIKFLKNDQSHNGQIYLSSKWACRAKVMSSKLACRANGIDPSLHGLNSNNRVTFPAMPSLETRASIRTEVFNRENR